MSQRALLAVALAAASAVPHLAHAQQPATEVSGPSWMRYPAISPDGKTIVFTWKGDLYRVPASGGQAVPLTSHPGHRNAAQGCAPLSKAIA